MFILQNLYLIIVKECNVVVAKRHLTASLSLKYIAELQISQLPIQCFFQNLFILRFISI